MRTAVSLLVLALVPTLAPAAPPEKSYYAGEIKLSSPAGKPMGSQVIILEKTQDKDNALIIERAVLVQQDGKVEEFTVRLSIKDDNTFTLVDDAKMSQGQGTLFGPAWKWTYLKGTFKTKNGLTIEDENFFGDDSAVFARKKLITPDNQVFMYMDMGLKSITPKTFELLRTALLKK